MPFYLPAINENKTGEVRRFSIFKRIIEKIHDCNNVISILPNVILMKYLRRLITPLILLTFLFIIIVCRICLRKKNKQKKNTSTTNLF